MKCKFYGVFALLADIELHDTTIGKLIASVGESAENLPAWAKPYAD